MDSGLPERAKNFGCKPDCIINRCQIDKYRIYEKIQIKKRSC